MDQFPIPENFVGKDVEVAFIDAIMTPKGPTYLATKGIMLDQTASTLTLRTAHATMVIPKSRISSVAMPNSVQTAAASDLVKLR